MRRARSSSLLLFTLGDGGGTCGEVHSAVDSREVAPPDEVGVGVEVLADLFACLEWTAACRLHLLRNSNKNYSNERKRDSRCGE